MFYYLILLFTIVPLVELYILIKIGHYLGAFTTVAIVVFTGAFGAYLARLEGLRVLFGVQRDIQEGRVPQEGLLDGFLILVGAVLLITPGILTDITGFLLVIPLTRALIKKWARYQIQKIIDRNENIITINTYRRHDDDNGGV